MFLDLQYSGYITFVRNTYKKIPQNPCLISTRLDNNAGICQCRHGNRVCAIAIYLSNGSIPFSDKTMYAQLDSNSEIFILKLVTQCCV